MFKLFTLLLLLTGVGARCVNEQGHDRSWFLMLKMPDGYDYLYAGIFLEVLKASCTV